MREAGRAGRTVFERCFGVVLVLKGVDGAVETVLGLVLLVAPAAAGAVLQAGAAELAEGTGPVRSTLASVLERADLGVVGASAGLVVFLLVYGLVKLVTVVALLRRLVRVYPWAIGALAVLLVLQVVAVAAGPSVLGVALVLLDVLVLALVLHEYRLLRRGGGQPLRAETVR